MKKVLIGIPTRGRVNVLTMFSLIEVKKDSRFKVSVYASMDGLSVENNRNKIVKYFLEEGDWDYLFLLDDDVVPPANILDLVTLEKDIVGGVYKIFRNTQNPEPEYGAFWHEAETNRYKSTKGAGLVEVDAINGGCLLISRNVLQEIQTPFTAERNDQGLWALGEDLSFCKSARALGFKVFAHFGYECGHVTEVFV